MKVQLESTTKIVELNGVPARVWEGVTESGIEVHAFITRVAVNQEEDTSQFEQELQVCREPSADVDAYDFRLIL